MTTFVRIPVTARGSIPSLVLASTVLLYAAGCSNKQTLMPTPVMLDDGNADPFMDVPAVDRTTSYPVYVFTDREPSGKPNPALMYSDERSREGRLATATVEIGAGMDWDHLAQESVQERRDRKPTIELVKLEEMGILWTTVRPEPLRLVRTPVADAAAKAPAEQFVAEVNDKLSRSNLKDIFIFVHGFNTEFDANQGIAAELHHYLGREGVFITYAWPSRHSLFAYDADKANARYSTRMFRQFLTFLAESTDARKINILAHSAGAPIAVNALREMRLINYDEEAPAVQARYRIGQFVLVAPDMDLMDYMNAELDGVEDVPERLTIYISTKDRALHFSSMIFKAARLGEPLEALTPEELAEGKKHPNLDIIDVAAAEKKHGSWLGHSYFHDDPWVSSDLLLLLRYGIPARDRGLSRPDDGRNQWSFPEDYSERVRTIASDLDHIN